VERDIGVGVVVRSEEGVVCGGDFSRRRSDLDDKTLVTYAGEGWGGAGYVDEERWKQKELDIKKMELNRSGKRSIFRNRNMMKFR